MKRFLNEKIYLFGDRYKSLKRDSELCVTCDLYKVCNNVQSLWKYISCSSFGDEPNGYEIVKTG